MTASLPPELRTKLQLMFNKAVIGVRRQGRLALDVKGDCCYRAVDPNTGATLKCGIGHLIADEDYYPGLEGNIVARHDSDDTGSTLVVKAAGVPDELIDAARDLQNCHDDATSNLAGVRVLHDVEQMTRFANLCKRFASCYDLDDRAATLPLDQLDTLEV
jgi:hypothetical protein